MELRRLFFRKVIPWNQITAISDHVFNYVTIRGPSGVLAFSSADFFPRLIDLLSEVHRYSGCKLSPNIHFLIYGTVDETYVDGDDKSERDDEDNAASNPD